MSAEENKVVLRRLIEEVYNRGNLDIADELLFSGSQLNFLEFPFHDVHE